MGTEQRSEEYCFEPFKVTQEKYRGKKHPLPRSGHRIACDDTNIYCFGGYNPALTMRRYETWSPERPLFRELWSYNIANRKWKQHRVVANMPDELASCAMCMNGKQLMIFGGTGAPFGNKCSNNVITWQVGKGDAELKVLAAEGQRPPGQYGQAALCHNGHFYAVGGTNGFSYNCDIYRLNLKSLIWETVFIGTGQNDEPIGRYRHETAKVGNKLYVIGGGTGDWAFELAEIPVFDLETKQWSIEVPKMDESFKPPINPIQRKCHSAVQLNTPDGAQVFVTGGFDGDLVFQDIWRLEIPKMQWTLMRGPILPSPLYFHSATVTTFGCMYLFGGIEATEAGGVRSNRMYKVWLCIPKLSEICWEAVLHTNPAIYKKKRKSLLKAGIPWQYVDRLKPN